GTTAPPVKDRRRRELPVRKADFVLRHRRAKHPQVVIAGLMTKSARAGVYQDGDLIHLQSESARDAGFVDRIDAAYFEEVVSRTQCAELFPAALVRALADPVRIRRR